MAKIWDEKWELGDRLGKGGQGVTHSATSKDGAGTIGALKYLKNNKDQQARGRMRREVANLQSLAAIGANVPRVLDHNTDLFEGSEQLFVVMELIAGSTLDEHIEKNGVLGIERGTEVVLSLLNTIETAHAQTILHRDLKPQNIMVRDIGTCDVVIVDYGLSFNTEDDDLTQTVESFQNKFLDLPETNTPSGNLRDPRSDLTALCGIFYYCLTGHRPGQLQDGNGALPHQRPDYSLRNFIDDDARVFQMERFFNRGFSPNIANRFQTSSDLRSAIKVAASERDAEGTNDPIKRAAILTERIRETDRATQISIHQEHAKPLLTKISQLPTKYDKKLGNFTLTGVGNFPKPTMPDQVDLVKQADRHFNLAVNLHQLARQKYYIIGSRLDECVLLTTESTHGGGRTNQHREIGNWNEVGWYRNDPAILFDLLEDDFTQWLNSSLDAIAQQIATASQKNAT